MLRNTSVRVLFACIALGIPILCEPILSQETSQVPVTVLDPPVKECRIADRKTSCETEFGVQQNTNCPGCNADNKTCPGSAKYSTASSLMSSTSWTKNRALSTKLASSGYAVDEPAVAACGNKGDCSTSCVEMIFEGNTYYGCPKSSYNAVTIDYFNYSVPCPGDSGGVDP